MLEPMPMVLLEPGTIRSFKGHIEEGVYQRRGEVVFENGNIYDGNFLNGRMNGIGTYRWIEKGIEYSGDFVNNRMEGNGIMKWSNGYTYTGQFQSGKRHGHGRLENAELNISYEGEWQSSYRHGYGEALSGSISKYKGEWMNGKRHGKGLMVFDSENTFDGQWVEDTPQGFGTWEGNKSKYVGEWKAGKPEGEGQYIWVDASLSIQSIPKSFMHNHYEGSWLDGKRHGKGTFFYADGAKYVGDWDNNLKHGPGVYTYPDGRVFRGEFSGDAMVGSVSENKELWSIGVTLNVQDILTDSGPDIRRSIKEIENVLLRHHADLRAAYIKGCSIPSGHNSMKASQFWAICRVCGFIDSHMTVSFINKILLQVRESHGSNVECIHNDSTVLLYREFMETLVRIAFWKYSASLSEFSMGCLVSRLLVSDLKKFLDASNESVLQAAEYFADIGNENSLYVYKVCANHDTTTPTKILSLLRYVGYLKEGVVFEIPVIYETKQDDESESKEALDESAIPELSEQEKPSTQSVTVHLHLNVAVAAIQTALLITDAKVDMQSDILRCEFSHIFKSLISAIRSSNTDALCGADDECVESNFIESIKRISN